MGKLKQTAIDGGFMQNTPFHTYKTARHLAGLAKSKSFIPVFASSYLDVFPYQVAAANFAMRSSYIKGCILCDEGSLGKTYEALLIAAQNWYEGRSRQLLVLPTNLVAQWTDKIDNDFTLPYTVWDYNNAHDGSIPESDGIIITTYDFAVRHAEVIGGQTWDMVIFDEADVLFKPENKTVAALKEATTGAYKLLLTPTPITMSIMDIYGLIHFIDETVLPDAEDFYKRYFRKPENYPELTSWVSQYAFRTLKNQVTEYVNFTKRLPITIDYALTTDEQELYAMVGAYLNKTKKAAYPNMDNYELTLMYYHILSSSPKAFAKTIDNPLSRLNSEDEAIIAERNQLLKIRDLADSIIESGKMKALVDTLKACFAQLRQLKLNQKAIIFVNNITTLGLLADLLEKHSYFTITGSSEDSIKWFRDKKSAVFITTDKAAKGLDMEFCPLVINYDLLYNAIEMEQRIARCHRQGQTSDVVVVNLLSKENLSDVRILELINKRTLQFNGIFGMSDDIVGNFDVAISEVLEQMRKPSDIAEAFNKNLAAHEDNNRRQIAQAEDTLFTTFTKSVADSVRITPQYVHERTSEIEAALWELTKTFFARRDDYEINDKDRTLTLLTDTRPTLFYHWAGSGSRPYTGLKAYGMGRDFKPSNARITLTSVVGRAMLNAAACADKGTIIVDSDIEPCEIALYKVSVTNRKTRLADYDVLVGITETGEILNDEQCNIIMSLPVLSFTEDGKQTENWLRNVTGLNDSHRLDGLVPEQQMIDRYLDDNSTAQAEEVERIKLRAMRKKAALGHSLDDLKHKIKAVKQESASHTGDRLKELAIDKKLKELEKKLRGEEQNLFFEQMKIDVAADEEIAGISDRAKFTARTQQQFVVKIKGGFSNG